MLIKIKIYISNDIFLNMTCFLLNFIEVSPVLIWTIEFQDISRFSTGLGEIQGIFIALKKKKMSNSRTFQESKDALEP